MIALHKPRFTELTRRLRIERPVEVRLVSPYNITAMDPNADGRWEMQDDGSHRIYIRKGYDAKRSSALLLHEVRHAHQVERWLGLSDRRIADHLYVQASISAHRRGGDPYLDNIMERDARNFAIKHRREWHDLFIPVQ